MLPGDPSIDDDASTERESIITISTEDRSIVRKIESKSESVTISIFSSFTQRRIARALICHICSSPDI